MLAEGNGVSYLAGGSMYQRCATNGLYRLAGLSEEICDAHRFELERRAHPAFGLGDKLMIAEIERQRDQRVPVRHRSRSYPAGSGVEGRVPGMVNPRSMREPIFADDLRPQVQSGASLAPFRIVDGGPLNHSFL